MPNCPSKNTRVHVSACPTFNPGVESWMAMKQHRQGRGRVRSTAYSGYLRGVRRWLYPTICALGVSLTTCLYYFAIRAHNVELSFDQQLALERQTQVLANHTVYVTSGSGGELLEALAPLDWGKVSKRVEWVFFTRASPSAPLVAAVANAFRTFRPPGLGIVQFSCGCAIPNAYVRRTRVRFSGAECLMLPGFVFPSAHVAWVDSQSSVSCTNRAVPRALTPGWYSLYEHKLVRARDDFATIKEELIEERAEELRKTNADVATRRR